MTEALRQRLRALKATHQLTAQAIGRLVHRKPGTIRQYLCGWRETPPEVVDLLELKLAKGER